MTTPEQLEFNFQNTSTAPRVTLDDVHNFIEEEIYFRGSLALQGTTSEKSADILSCITFCILVLKNGYTVTGQSACVSPENFNYQIGKEIAKQNAVDQIWPLLGFNLKSKLTNTL